MVGWFVFIFLLFLIWLINFFDVIFIWLMYEVFLIVKFKGIICMLFVFKYFLDKLDVEFVIIICFVMVIFFFIFYELNVERYVELYFFYLVYF